MLGKSSSTIAFEIIDHVRIERHLYKDIILSDTNQIGKKICVTVRNWRNKFVTGITSLKRKSNVKSQGYWSIHQLISV